MKNVYERIPVFEDSLILREVKIEDTDGLLKIYSDKFSLQFFNSDNCHDDNFFYDSKEKMEKAIKFWFDSYNSKCQSAG